MKPQLIASFVIVLGLAIPNLVSAQLSDNIRVTNLEEYRASAPPEPLGMQPAILYSDKVKRRSEREVWLTYVQARQNFAVENELETPDAEGEILPSYGEELAARKALAAALKEMGRKVGKTHRAYAADLEKIIEANFFDEYVFSVHHRAGWDDAGRDLRIADYKAWATENIPDHQPLSYASRIAMASNRTADVFLVIDSELEIESEAAFWLTYCRLRMSFRNDNGLPFDLLIGEEAVPTFKEELAARRGLLKEFTDVQDSLCKETQNAIRQMVKAEGAGFLREYVWKYLHCEGWEEPAELKVKEFEEWAKAELADHKAPTHAMLVGR